MDQSIEYLVVQLSEKLKKRAWKLITVESCTGGGLAYTLTSLPGSSEWFECGYVTYSNESKERLIGVNSLTLNTFGAVSEQTAREMAEGALQKNSAHLTIAITGIAGPDGGTKEKPVGTTWIACAGHHAHTQARVDILSGSRREVREQAIKLALETALQFLG